MTDAIAKLPTPNGRVMHAARVACCVNGECQAAKAGMSKLCGAKQVAAIVRSILRADRQWLGTHGWTIVPKEPTPEMLHVMERDWDSASGTVCSQWAAMLDAAPKPEMD